MFLVRQLTHEKIDLNSGQWYVQAVLLQMCPECVCVRVCVDGWMWVCAHAHVLSLSLSQALSIYAHLRNSGNIVHQRSAQPGNGGFFPFSTDLPFAQYGWPTADAATRAAIFEEHKWWTQALLFYLSNDAELLKIQPALVAEMKSYGRCADEYV